MSEAEDSFIWRQDDQMDYYQIIYNDYLRTLFKTIANTDYVFFWDMECDDYDYVLKYLKHRQPIYIKDFEVDKKTLIKSHYITLSDDDAMNSRHESNTIFTVSDCDYKEELGGCGQCGLRYGGGFWFTGVAHNVSTYPVEYDGLCKTYDFFICKCDEYTSISEKEYLPVVEVLCTTENINLLCRCMLFGLKIVKISNIEYIN